MIRDDATVGDRLQAMTVQTESPDGKIWARVHDYTQLTVGFYPFTYEQYDEPGLSYQLSRLGILTWVAWSRERTDIYRRTVDLTTEEAERAPWTEDPARRQYDAELNAIEAEGVSAHGALRIRTLGMMQWQVDIEPHTLRRFDQHTFAGEIRSAFEALMADRRRRLIILKSDYFDLGIPRRWRDIMTEARAVNSRQRP